MDEYFQRPRAVCDCMSTDSGYWSKSKQAFSARSPQQSKKVMKGQGAVAEGGVKEGKGAQ